MKIHYISGHFYIEQDGNKIKIANPEELPIIQDPLGNGLIWDVANYTSFIESGDTFDLPKELSVKIQLGCYKCGAYFSSEDKINCHNAYCEKETRAIISKSSSQTLVENLRYWQEQEAKSSSPEKPNNSEKPDFKKIASKLMGNPKYLGADAIDTHENLMQGMRKIWETEVIPRDKTISDLRETLTKCEKTFGILSKLFTTLEETPDNEIPRLIEEVDIDFELIQAKIKDQLKWKI